jgi:transcriptional regulator with XRE-family HTH domain
MASVSNVLIIQCRMALGLTQDGLGDLLGCTKRSIQRYEDGGASLVPPQIEALARAVYPVQPDLAAQIAASGETTLERLGLVPPSPSATSESIDAVVRAAADVMGVPPDAIRPAIAVAFAKARDLGLDVAVVADGLPGPATR